MQATYRAEQEPEAGLRLGANTRDAEVGGSGARKWHGATTDRFPDGRWFELRRVLLPEGMDTRGLL